MSSAYRFTTLERSLATLGAGIHNTVGATTGVKRKRNNKRSVKTKVSTIVASIPEENIADNISNADAEWISVASKSSKARVSSIAKSTDPDSITPTPLPAEVAKPRESLDSAKRKRRKANKSNSVGVAVEESQNVADAPSTTPTLPSNQQEQQSETTLTAPSLHATQKSSEKTDTLTYAHELELIVSEMLGEEAVVKVRASFPELKFLRPPPITSSLSDPNKAVHPSDYIQMKAHLRAKEAECQVLHDEVVRLCTQTSNVSPIATDTQQKEASKSAESQQTKQSVLTASKHVQCQIPAPVTEEEAPKSVTPTASSESIEAKVICTLQSEIARLAKENILSTQRQTNLEGRLENAKQLNSTLRSEARKAAALASKETKAAVRQEMDEVVKKLHLELVEKEERICTYLAQIELMEQTKNELEQNVTNIQQEHDNLLEMRHAEELHLAETVEGLENTRKELDAALQENALMNKSYSQLRSSLESEVNALQMQSIEAETHSKAILNKCAHLEEELASNEAELIATKTSIAEMVEKHDSEVFTLKAHVEELVKKNEQLSQLPPAELTPPTIRESGVCDQCSHLSAEVVRLQMVIASAEDALSKLQSSVGKVENRWRITVQECLDKNAQLAAKLHRLTSQSVDAEVIPAIIGGLNSKHVSSKAVENGGTSSNGHNHSALAVENGGLEEGAMDA